VAGTTVSPRSGSGVAALLTVPKAAERANMPLKDYVIGGLDPGFNEEHLKPTTRRDGAPDECAATQTCIDEYLWSLYEPDLST
jgi:hypothetical protein